MAKRPAVDDLERESTLHLVSKARSGDREALEVICRRYLPRVRTWIRGRLPDNSRDLYETDDLAQEALMQVLRRLDHFDPHHSGAFLAFVRKTVRNKLTDRYRRGKKLPLRTDDIEIRDDRPSPLEELIAVQRVRAYEEALDRLDAVDRALIFSRFELKLTFEEIAHEFDKPSADAARMGVKRAVGRLVKQMRTSDDGTV